MTDKTYTQDQVDMVKINNKLDNIEKIALENREMLRKEYVTKDELALRDQKIELLQKIVYGVVGLILTGVVGAIISLVIIKP